jgi:hypothetical protein
MQSYILLSFVTVDAARCRGTECLVLCYRCFYLSVTDIVIRGDMQSVTTWWGKYVPELCSDLSASGTCQSYQSTHYGNWPAAAGNTQSVICLMLVSIATVCACWNATRLKLYMHILVTKCDALSACSAQKCIVSASVTDLQMIPQHI